MTVARDTLLLMTPCVEFVGHITAKGYGRQRGQYAHRIAWELKHGPIPDGMVVMHMCDNPSCVNVEHLQLGTQADNMNDMYAKGRGKNGPLDRTHCRHGHEFTVENTGYRRGYRYCRTCNADSERRRRGQSLSD